MSVNIFGGGRNSAANASHASVGNVDSDRNFNQILIILSHKFFPEGKQIRGYHEW